MKLRTFPATFALLVVNILVFAACSLAAGTYNDPFWTVFLLDHGADFNPFTLDKEWYRLFSHMFLHGSLAHIAFNMYALFVVGREVESMIGTPRFLLLYFLAGVAGALVSLYASLFTISVGASGAIFGLFGFSLVYNIATLRRNGDSVFPVVLNFVFFLLINLLFAEVFKADTAAHLGGLAMGILLAGLSVIQQLDERSVRNEVIFIPVLVMVFFALPRYQVSYYKFFQNVVAAEDSTKSLGSKKFMDDEIVVALKNNVAQWDSALQQLDAHTYLPEALHADTFKLRRYLTLRKHEGRYKITMFENESYIYLDSIEIVQDSMKHYLMLDRPVFVRPRVTTPDAVPSEPVDQKEPVPLLTKVYYNDAWEEIPHPPAAFYRIGYRDSTGRWNGWVRDYYADGKIQMKGLYKDDKKDGIFLYYSAQSKYESAGRYVNDTPVGKWEDFHRNGKLKQEVFYSPVYFVKTYRDSLGHVMVSDGVGRVVEYYPNGGIKTEGQFRDGAKHGVWYGLHSDGTPYFQEDYANGRLIRGKARTRNGNTFIYDETSLFPVPVDGWQKYNAYVQRAVRAQHFSFTGSIKLSFRVTPSGKLTDFRILEGVSSAADAWAKQIVRDGPQWRPAKQYGHLSIDGYAVVTVDF